MNPYKKRLKKWFSPFEESVSASRLHKMMRISIIAGATGMPWLVTFLPGYILNVFFKNYLGGSAFLLGLMVALIHFTNFGHLAAIYIYARLKTIKTFWWICHLLHRMLGFVPALICIYVIHGGDVYTARIIMIVTITLSFFISNISSSGWFAWMGVLVPANIRASFFTRRIAISNIVSILWFFLVTMALDVQNQHALSVFAVIFFFAGIGGVVDIALHVFIRERLSEPKPPIQLSLFLEPLKNKNFRYFALAYALYMFSFNILNPFLGPYLTAEEGIGAPNIWLGILVMIIQLTTIATLSQWGLVMDRVGRKPVALIGSLAFIANVGWFFLTPQNYIFIVPVIAFVTGALNPAFVEGINQLMLTITPDKNKTTFVGWFMAIVGIANGAGSLLGGILYDIFSSVHMTVTPWLILDSFHMVALINITLCALSLIILVRIHEGGEKPIGFVVSRLATPGIVKTFSSMAIISRPKSSLKVAKALSELEGYSGSFAVSDVLARLDDPDPDVREEAARALGRTKSLEGVEALILRLLDPTSTIRIVSANALGNIGDERAVPALIQALNTGSEDLKEACIKALGKIGGTESVSHLIKLLQEENSERIKTQSADAVARHGVFEAAYEILPLMHQTRNPVLRRQLAISLANLMGRPGEFYKDLTSENVAFGNRINRLFTEALRSLAMIEKTKKIPKNELVNQLRSIQNTLESEKYLKTLDQFLSLIKSLVSISLQKEIKDDEALLYYVIYRNVKLGMLLWFVQEINAFGQKSINEDILKTDLLLIMFFIASLKAEEV
ncbi:MFS transporter [candidate division KSB1 bacterium]|nr:MFS transporter [candidate division KSB1 bacterium]